MIWNQAFQIGYFIKSNGSIRYYVIMDTGISKKNFYFHFYNKIWLLLKYVYIDT